VFDVEMLTEKETWMCKMRHETCKRGNGELSIVKERPEE
jgi:hypothetical protein